MQHGKSEQALTRRLSVFDMEEFGRHLLRLDQDSRRMRFGAVVTDQFLLDYARSSARWNVLLYGYFIGGVLRAVGELRPIAGGGEREAELAFSVEAEFRGRGVGAHLFSRLLRAARNRRCRRLHLSFISSNDAMQALARRFKAKLTFEKGGGAGVVLPGPASPASLISEAADEAAAFVFGTIQLPKGSLLDFSRLFRRSA